MIRYDPYDFELVRKPDPVPPPPYDCSICERTIAISGSVYNWPRHEFRSGPVCQGCAHHWGYSNAVHRFHKDERAKVMKLAAIIAALEWEILNGVGRWRKGFRHA